MVVITDESDIVQELALIPGNIKLPKGWHSYFPFTEPTLPNRGERYIPAPRRKLEEKFAKFGAMRGSFIEQISKEEIPAYLSFVATTFGAMSDEFIESADWVVKNLGQFRTD